MAINSTHEEARNTQTSGMGVPHILTYTDIINSHLPAAHLNTMAKTPIRVRQVLINKDPTVDTNNIQVLTK